MMPRVWLQGVKLWPSWEMPLRGLMWEHEEQPVRGRGDGLLKSVPWVLAND